MVDLSPLYNEILTEKMENKKLKEKIAELEDLVDDLRERIYQLEWAMGI